MRIVCISDTHGLARGVDIPDGDLLLHAGDLTGRGRPTEIAAEADWLRSLPHRRKVVIAGNHDFGLETDAVRCRPLLRGLVYLEDAETDFEGLRIWGSPWQPRFFDWAFNLDRGPAIRAKWDLIPAGIDILVTHGPPARILDRTAGEQDAGCADLREAVRRVRPRLHLFGHIHEGYGRLEEDGTTFVNASLCDLAYEPVNPPIVVDL
jgi:predicted MPP superfamily phosphohydrolase